MESLMMAMKAIKSNKMRSFLTMLGIVIGVLSIIVLTAFGQSSNATVVENIESMGTNLLSVNVKARKNNNPVTEKTLVDLMQQPSIEYAAPMIKGSGTLKAGLTQYEDGSIIATSSGYEKIRNMTLQSGRFITAPDDDNRSFVAVLGQEAAVELYGSVDVLGQTFTYKGYAFTVVGVLNEIGSSMQGSSDNVVIIPFSLGERLFNQKGIQSFYVSATSPEEVANAQTTLEMYMDNLFQKSNQSSSYSIYNQASMLDTLNETTSTLTLMLAGIAAISLLVGGIGIMNIMLVSVSERTREIGIRKAIGATRKNILAQFLIEALTVSLLGGLIGLALSFSLLKLLEPVFSMKLTIMPQYALLSVLFSVFIGVLFGIYPANKASKMRPIDALRHE